MDEGPQDRMLRRTLGEEAAHADDRARIVDRERVAEQIARQIRQGSHGSVLEQSAGKPHPEPVGRAGDLPPDR